jgi:hypothetical protein
MLTGLDTRVVGSFLESSQMRYRNAQICDVSSVAALDLMFRFEHGISSQRTSVASCSLCCS